MHVLNYARVACVVLLLDGMGSLLELVSFTTVPIVVNDFSVVSSDLIAVVELLLLLLALKLSKSICILSV